MAKLGDFISPAKNIKCGDGKYPVLSMTMHDGIVLQSDRFKKSLASADQSGYKVVDYGQLVVGFPIDEGVLYLQRVIEQGIMSPAYNVWDVDYSHVDPSYFELSLHSPQAMQYYKENLRGSTARRRSLPKEVLLELPLKMPSMDEQKRVATSIDKLTHLIDMRSKQLDKLDELVKSRFIEMFGDPVTNPHALPVVTLGERSELITKGASPSWQGFSYTDDNSQTLFITSENVREGYIDLSSPKYIEDGFNEKQKRSVIHKGDFLINIVGASIGRAAQFNLECKANMNQASALVRIRDDRVNDKYLLIYLNSEKAQMMYDSMKSDTGRANLSLQDISNLSILLPPINQQIELENFVAQVDKSKLAVQKSLEQLEILKKALMQEYFG